MPGTFANRSLIDPLAVYRHCQRFGLPIDWISKANRFECPIGHEAGTGFILLTRNDLDQLDLDTTHDLVLHDGKASVTIKRLHVAGSTQCLTPGAPLDKKAVHLVPLADHRRIFKLTALNRGYNLRQTPTGNYQATTATDETTAITWTEIWGDLWGRLPAAYAGVVPTLPAELPADAPESIAYHDWTVIDAIGDFLSRLAFMLVWNPFTDAFSVAQLGTTQAGLAGWEAAALNYRLYDLEPVENQLGLTPGGVEVFFRKMPTRAYGNTQFETFQVDDAGSTLPGRQILRDDRIATYQGGDLTNTTALGTQADLRASEFFAARKEWFAKAKHLIYSGIRGDFVPGAELQAVAWSSMGRRGPQPGVMTHVKRRPPRDPVAEWPGTPEQPWRLVELVCVFENGNYDSGTTPPTGYFDAEVIRWNPVLDDYEFLFLCWVKDVNDQNPPPSGRYPDALFSGFHEERPVYAIGCCPDGLSPCAFVAGDGGGDTSGPHPPPPPPISTVCGLVPHYLELNITATGDFSPANGLRVCYQYHAGVSDWYGFPCWVPIGISCVANGTCQLQTYGTNPPDPPSLVPYANVLITPSGTFNYHVLFIYAIGCDAGVWKEPVNDSTRFLEYHLNMMAPFCDLYDNGTATIRIHNVTPTETPFALVNDGTNITVVCGGGPTPSGTFSTRFSKSYAGIC